MNIIKILKGLMALLELFGTIANHFKPTEKEPAKLTVSVTTAHMAQPVIPKETILRPLEGPGRAVIKIDNVSPPPPQKEGLGCGPDPYADGKHSLQEDLKKLRRIAENGES